MNGSDFKNVNIGRELVFYKKIIIYFNGIFKIREIIVECIWIRSFVH
jgi:hypothetical protein